MDFEGIVKTMTLYRDFIKTDSKNSATFQQIFNTWQPEIFLDNHTSNGSDYQYVMTLIPSQKDKLNPVLSEYLRERLVPYIYTEMENQGFPMVPYVNSMGQTPETGIMGFLESPRYSTGYANLHNVIGFMPEVHMLKEYPLRVDATYVLMEKFIKIIQQDAQLIGTNKRKADEAVVNQIEFPLDWQLEKSVVDSILFKGYESGMKKSLVSGLDRLYYDRSKPFEKYIKELNTYIPTIVVQKPIAYIIPKAWDKVIELLKLNQVALHELKKDQKFEVQSYYIKDYKTSARPYEGHYLHSEVEVIPVLNEIQYYAGDFVVYVNQVSNRYIVETLEPQATDSYFNWNFFDSILSMKEYFSAYIFEDTAVEILNVNPDLRSQLEIKKNEDSEFRNNAQAQLEFVYKRSDYYEKTHNRYPIARLLNNKIIDLPPN